MSANAPFVGMHSTLPGAIYHELVLFMDGIPKWKVLPAILAPLIILHVLSMSYWSTIHPLSKIPGHWAISSSSLWIRWQRWNGRLSFKADALLTKYGPIVRISPSMVLVNEHEAVEKIFIRKGLEKPRDRFEHCVLVVTTGQLRILSTP